MRPRLKILADKYPRRYGVFATLLGAGLLYWAMYLPIQQAQQHVAHVHTYMKGTIVGIALTCFGLLRMVFGRQLTALFEPSAGGSKVAAIILGLLVVGFGFYAHHVLQTYLEAQGYRFH